MLDKLQRLTIKELNYIAKGLNIKGTSKMKKYELINAILVSCGEDESYKAEFTNGDLILIKAQNIMKAKFIADNIMKYKNTELFDLYELRLDEDNPNVSIDDVIEKLNKAEKYKVNNDNFKLLESMSREQIKQVFKRILPNKNVIYKHKKDLIKMILVSLDQYEDINIYFSLEDPLGDDMIMQENEDKIHMWNSLVDEAINTYDGSGGNDTLRFRVVSNKEYKGIFELLLSYRNSLPIFESEEEIERIKKEFGIKDYDFFDDSSDEDLFHIKNEELKQHLLNTKTQSEIIKIDLWLEKFYGLAEFDYKYYDKGMVIDEYGIHMGKLGKAHMNNNLFVFGLTGHGRIEYDVLTTKEFECNEDFLYFKNEEMQVILVEKCKECGLWKSKYEFLKKNK